MSCSSVASTRVFVCICILLVYVRKYLYICMCECVSMCMSLYFFATTVCWNKMKNIKSCADKRTFAYVRKPAFFVTKLLFNRRQTICELATQTLFLLLDFDLEPMTSIRVWPGTGLDFLKMYYLPNKNKRSRSTPSKFRARTRHVDSFFLFLWPWP